MWKRRVKRVPELHLSVSIRSFRAERVSEFVAAVLDGDIQKAREACESLTEYPMVLTRDLESARLWLRTNARGTERFGLVASSNALRLKPIGIHVKANIEPTDWFLADQDDVRSSYALEDAATEFHIQGLELDWVGVCWDANFRREPTGWTYWNFRGTRWERVRDATRVTFLRNSYRVLLTRARQGMVVLVPQGSEVDKTRSPEFYDRTFEYLKQCGIPELAENSFA